MNVRQSTLAALLVSAAKGAWAVLVNSWRATFSAVNAYRPEAHYMRGPGPKWREKHTGGSGTALV